MAGLVALLATLALLAAVLAWRLSAGPIRLPFLETRIEQALSALGPDTVAKVRSAELVWARRRPAIRVVGVDLLDSDGDVIASLPDLLLHPSLRAALRGRLALASLGLSGARLALLRTAQGRISVRTDKQSDDASRSQAAAGWLAALAGVRAGGAAHYLSRIHIIDASLVLDDQLLGSEWRIDGADVDVRRRLGGLTTNLQAVLTLRSTTGSGIDLVVPLTATVDASFTKNGALTNIAFLAQGEQGRISSAASTPAVSSAAASSAGETRGADTAAASSGTAGGASAGTSDATAQRTTGTDGDTPVSTAAAVAIESLAVEGSYSDSTRAIDVRSLQLVTAAGRLDLTARVPVGSRQLTEVRGEIHSLRVDDLPQFWPPTLADGTRKWIAENVHDGTVPSCRFHLRIPPGGRGGVPLAEDAVDVAFEVEGLTVTYLRSHDPLREVRGSAKLTAHRFEADVAGGTNGSLAMERGRVEIDLRTRPRQATITADVKGPTAQMLSVIDRPPLTIPSKLDIRPEDATGDADAHVELHMPLARGVTAKDVHVVASATVRAASLPDVVAGIGIHDGAFTVHVKDRHVEIRGQTAATGAWWLSDPVQVAFAFDPQPDGSRRLKGTIETGELSTDGEVALDTDGVRTVTLSKLHFGRTELAAEIARNEPRRYHLSLHGEALDLEPLLARLGEDNAESSVPRVGWDLDLSVTRLLTHNIELADVDARGQGEADTIRMLRAAGSVVGGGAFEIDLVPNGAARQLTASSDQAGGLLRALRIYDHIEGGRVSVAATLPEGDAAGAAQGQIEVSRFRVVQAPLLAEILSLGSLDGIASVLGREGIAFTRARVPFVWTRESFEIHDASAVGAIGITADGEVGRSTDEIELRGLVIPAYTLNSALGKIPLVGKLLVGGEGSGVFGIDYWVSGSRRDPKVGVNPLTALAPGILRQLFIEPFSPRRSTQK